MLLLNRPPRDEEDERKKRKERQSDHVKLVAWLKRDFPRDVLMPVLPGTKRPASAHKDGAWDWSCWDRSPHSVPAYAFAYAFANAFAKAPPPPDICVLLRDLCVVDIDAEEIALAFEARFPVLKRVPCERTRKGRHYWFVRPPWADAEGFFDGAAQVQSHVDFKSVCGNGTSGIVVVAPSEGKAWERGRRPWDADSDLIELPRDLMEAVASPRWQRSSFTLRCMHGNSNNGGNETIERTSCRWARRMAYFKPFLSGHLVIPDDGIPVPELVQPALLRELFHVLDHRGRMSAGNISYATLRGVCEVADFLGLDQQDIARFLPVSVAQIDLHDLCPAWEEAQEHEQEHEQVAVTPELSDSVRYASLLSTEENTRDDGCWLFQRRIFPHPGVREGDRVLAPNPAEAAEARLAAAGAGIVILILKRFAGRVVLAGGAALWCVAADGALAETKHDYDLFVIADSDDEASRTAVEVCAAIGSSRMYQTSNAITLWTNKDNKDNQDNKDTKEKDKAIVIQIVLRRYARIQEVAQSFDFGPCKVAAWYDTPFSSSLTIRAEREFVECMRHMALWLDLGRWSSSTAARALKYHHKGFEVFVPGTRRAAFRKAPEVGAAMHSVADLFAIEQQVLKSRLAAAAATGAYYSKRPKAALIVRPSADIAAMLGYPSDGSGMPFDQLVADIFDLCAHKCCVRYEMEVDKRCCCCCFRYPGTSVFSRSFYVLHEPVFMHGNDPNDPVQYLTRYDMEQAIRLKLKNHVTFDRMSASEVLTFSAMCKFTSNYSDRLRLVGALHHAARAIRSFVHFFAPPASNDNNNINSLTWTDSSNSNSNSNSNKRTQAVNLHALYDMKALCSILESEVMRHKEQQQQQQPYIVQAGLHSFDKWRVMYKYTLDCMYSNVRAALSTSHPRWSELPVVAAAASSSATASASAASSSASSGITITNVANIEVDWEELRRRLERHVYATSASRFRSYQPLW